MKGKDTGISLLLKEVYQKPQLWFRRCGRNPSYVSRSNKCGIAGKAKGVHAVKQQVGAHRSTTKVRFWMYLDANKKGKEWLEAWQGQNLCLNLIKGQDLSRYLRKNT